MSLYLDRFDYSVDVQALPSGVTMLATMTSCYAGGIYISSVNCYHKYICKQNYVFVISMMLYCLTGSSTIR
jgi:hypothetical protein